MKIFKISFLALSAASCFLLPASPSLAGTTLNLTEGLPDLTGSYLNVSYNKGSGAFLAQGYTTDYNTSGGEVGINALDLFTISANIVSNSPAFMFGGTLTIQGGEGASGPDETLLTGSLTEGAAGTTLGYGSDNNQVFEFLFTVTGGQDPSVLSQFGGIGAHGGIILDAEFGSGDVPFAGSWLNNFNNNNTDNGVANVFTVPEPSSSLLIVVAGGLFFGISRYRHLKATPRLCPLRK